MKIKMCITHIQSGTKWFGLRPEEELGPAINNFRITLNEITSMHIGNTILPGDFIRNHCVIEFIESV